MVTILWGSNQAGLGLKLNVPSVFASSGLCSLGKAPEAIDSAR